MNDTYYWKTNRQQSIMKLSLAADWIAQTEEVGMSITLFFGAFFGALLGFATQNRRFSICKYLFGKHPFVAKSIGVAFLLVFALVPSLALSGVVTFGSTPFFWGGCLVFSFIIGFFMTSCLMTDAPQESS